ncbi:MAG: tetratricopeptide repeat protein [Deltaproteobacteria bacterium]
MKRTYLLSFFLILLTLIVFIRVPFFDFVILEDTTHLDTHPHFTDPNPKQILEMWKKPFLNYPPLTYTLWGVSAFLSSPKPLSEMSHSQTGVLKDFRFQPVIFHSLPLLFHLGTVFLVFWLFCFLTSHPLGSFFGALLFAIHPVQVESVAWVSSLKEPLGGFLGVLASMLFLIGEETPPRSKTFKFLFTLSSGVFLLSLLSNPSSIAFPLILLAILFFLYKKERFIHGAKGLVVWILIALPFFAISNQSLPWSHSAPPKLILKEKVLLALDSLSFYFSKIMLPIHLGVDYGRTPEWVLNDTSIHTTAALFFVFLLALTLFLRWYKIQWALASGSLFICALLPVFVLNRKVFQASSSVADRDLYLALLGASLAVAFLIKYFSQKTWVTLGLTLFLVALGSRSYFQTGYWKNSMRLLTHALEINSESSIAHYSLGYYYEREESYDKAISHYKAAGALDPQIANFHRLGEIYLVLKQFDQAKYHFEQALLLNPLSSSSYQGLGLSYLGLGNRLLAQDNFAKANALSTRTLASSNILRSYAREKTLSRKSNKHRKSK